jgi:hypothetical protein
MGGLVIWGGISNVRSPSQASRFCGFNAKIHPTKKFVCLLFIPADRFRHLFVPIGHGNPAKFGNVLDAPQWPT